MLLKDPKLDIKITKGHKFERSSGRTCSREASYRWAFELLDSAGIHVLFKETCEVHLLCGKKVRSVFKQVYLYNDKTQRFAIVSDLTLLNASETF